MYEKKYMYLRSIKESNFGSKRIFDHVRCLLNEQIYIYIGYVEYLLEMKISIELYLRAIEIRWKKELFSYIPRLCSLVQLESLIKPTNFQYFFNVRRSSPLLENSPFLNTQITDAAGKSRRKISRESKQKQTTHAERSNKNEPLYKLRTWRW